MGGDFDHSDFVDPDSERTQRGGGSPAPAVAPASRAVGTSGVRPPSRDDLNRQVTEAQQALVELKRQQEELERERTQLEESRRRRAEYDQGRTEMLNHLTRGIGLLGEAEQNARRDAEQLARTLTDLRAAHDKVAVLKEESWTADNYHTELTRALTTLENARMEWNSAQLKWPVLSGKPAGAAGPAGDPAGAGGGAWLAGRSPVELARLGLALTWPVALAVLAAGLVVAFVVGRH